MVKIKIRGAVFADHGGGLFIKAFGMATVDIRSVYRKRTVYNDRDGRDFASIDGIAEVINEVLSSPYRESRPRLMVRKTTALKSSKASSIGGWMTSP
jgi:hypothetical protein